MTLIDYDAVDIATPVVQIQQSTFTVTEQVQVKPVIPAVESTTHLLKPDAEWGWEELRDYVVQAIHQRHGAFPRKATTECAIFKSFMSRWGSQAPAIARSAFEHFDGMWRGAPISVNRFCKASDVYFAAVIAERL